MRPLVLLSLITLAACATDDGSTAADPFPETAPEVPSAPAIAPDESDLAPTAAAPTAGAPATPTTAPPPPLAPVQAVPAAPDPPEGEHIMDDGTGMDVDMPMDHTMDGMPMDSKAHGDHDHGNFNH